LVGFCFIKNSSQFNPKIDAVVVPMLALIVPVTLGKSLHFPELQFGWMIYDCLWCQQTGKPRRMDTGDSDRPAMWFQKAKPPGK
jgi:hypothetical protein